MPVLTIALDSSQAKRELDAARQALDQTTASATGTEQAFVKLDKELDTSAKRSKATAENLKEVEKTVTSGSRQVEQFAQEVGKGGEALKKTGNEAQDSALAFAKSAALIAGAAAAIGGVAGTVQAYASFERILAQVGSVAGATADDFVRLEEVARSAGATTEFTAAQSGEGLLLLAQAGFDVDRSISALPGVLSLATAGAVGLAEAADFASNAVNQFGLSADDVGNVADVLVNTSNRSNSSVRTLAEALSYSGAIANALNIDLEETSAAIGVLSDAGIQGSRAGTSLNNIFRNLSAESGPVNESLAQLGLTFADVSLETNTLEQALTRLQEAGIGASQADAIAGAYGQAGLLALTANVDKLEELTAANASAEGSSERAAKAVGDNLTGAYRSLLSSVEGAQIKITGALEPGIRGLTDTTTEAVRAVFDLGDGFEEAGVGGTALATALGVLAGGAVLPAVASGFIAINKALALIGVAAAANPILAIASGAAAAVGGLLAFTGALTGAKDEAEKLSGALGKIVDDSTKFQGLLADIRAFDPGTSSDASRAKLDELATTLERIRGTLTKNLDASALIETADLLAKIQGGPVVREGVDLFEGDTASRITLTVEQALADGAVRGAAVLREELRGARESFDLSPALEGAVNRLQTGLERIKARPGDLGLQDALEEEIQNALDVLGTGLSLERVKAADLDTLFQRIKDAAGLSVIGGLDASQGRQPFIPEPFTPAGAEEAAEPVKALSEAYIEAERALSEFLGALRFEQEIVGLSGEQAAILRAEYEAFGKALYLGVPAALALSGVVGQLTAARLAEAEAIKTQEAAKDALIRRNAQDRQEAERDLARLAVEQDRARETAQGLIGQTGAQISLIGLSADAASQALDRLRFQQATVGLSTEEAAELLRQFIAAQDELDRKTKQLRAVEFIAGQFSQFSQEAIEGFRSVGDAFEDLIRRLSNRALSTALDNIFGQLFADILGKGGAGFFGSFFGTSGPSNLDLGGESPVQFGEPGFTGPPAPSGLGKSLPGGSSGPGIESKGLTLGDTYDLASGKGQGVTVNVSVGQQLEALAGMVKLALERPANVNIYQGQAAGIGQAAGQLRGTGLSITQAERSLRRRIS